MNTNLKCKCCEKRALLINADGYCPLCVDVPASHPAKHKIRKRLVVDTEKFVETSVKRWAFKG